MQKQRKGTYPATFTQSVRRNGLEVGQGITGLKPYELYGGLESVCDALLWIAAQ